MSSLLPPMGIKIIHPADGGVDALLQRALSLSVQQNRIVAIAPGVVPDKDLLPIRTPCQLPVGRRPAEGVDDPGIAPISFEGADGRWAAAVRSASL